VGGQPFELSVGEGSSRTTTVPIGMRVRAVDHHGRPHRHAYVGTFVWQASSPAVGRRQQSSARYLRQALPVQRRRRTGAEHVRLEKANEITNGLVGGLKIVLTFTAC
jgi:hypothetical protein